MNKQILSLIIASSIGCMATFMPWVSVPFLGSIDGTKGDGWLTFILFLIPLIICLINDKTKPLADAKFYLAIIPGGLAGLTGLWKVLDFQSKMSDISQIPYGGAISNSVSIGIGLYLVIIAGIAIPFLGFKIKEDNRNLDDKIETGS